MRKHSLGIAVALLALVACTEPPPDGTGRPPDGEPTADDIDGDGVPNDEDGDVDNDGNPNVSDLDIDGDRIPNEIDDDTDGDGQLNGEDDSPFGANPDSLDGPFADPDDDGEPNLTDVDDDNDGIPDGVFGENDCNGDGVAEPESADCDGFCIDLEGAVSPCDDGAPPGSGAGDNDGDDIPNPIDPDDDNDGIPDGEDPNDNGNDPCIGLEGPPPAACLEEPGEEGEGEEGEGEGNPNCSTTEFDPAAPIPPRILLVVDKSGSMNEDANGFGGSKWFATVDALDNVTHQIESRVELGLVMYPEGGDENTQCLASAGVDQQIRLNNADAIVDSLDPFGGVSIAAGGTPTATALLQARNSLSSLSADGGQRAVILATDGGPNCNGSLNGNTCTCVSGNQADCQGFAENCLDDVNAIAAANALNQAGFPVFVLGIDGASSFSGVMNGIAAAGGTGNFFGIGSADGLASTIEDIANRVASCRFDVPGAPNPNNITVSVDGVVQPRDTTRQNGWELIDVDTVELFGSACDAAAGATDNVAVQTCF